ncbi:hypothetical protein K0U07_05310 [bacterium]|nr:hypothetical protein [bacterium]
MDTARSANKNDYFMALVRNYCNPVELESVRPIARKISGWLYDSRALGESCSEVLAVARSIQGTQIKSKVLLCLVKFYIDQRRSVFFARVVIEYIQISGFKSCARAAIASEVRRSHGQY